MDFLKNLRPEVALPICLGVGAVLWLLSLLMIRRHPRSGDNLNTPARLFLVALRIAIGWHLTVEGLEKFKNPSWSSEGYLRESYGPFADRFRTIAGDRVVERVTVEDGKIPTLLDREWKAYFDRFVGTYQLTVDEQKAAVEILDQRKSDAVTKLSTTVWPAPVASTLTTPEVRNYTVPEYLAHYQKTLEEVRRVENERVSVEGKKAWDALKKAKADANKERAELKKIGDGLSAGMRTALGDIRNKAMDRQIKEARKAYEDAKTDEQKAQAESQISALEYEKKNPSLADYVAPPTHITWHPGTWTTLEGADWIMKHALVISGVCLILGLFSRLAALVGAGLIALIYVAMMPLPNWPAPAQSEGNYLYVNKNLIEILALLCLMCIPTGRWVGLDGILRIFNPFAWRSGEREPEPERPKEVVFPVRRPD
ncbi:MAG: hypothetical protein K2X38_21200 [Gemmataceae bacterium]|nr:hypothetical protein [Gemmataceae bacterium]